MSSELGLTETSPRAARLDGLGIFYIIFATTWTLLLLVGAAFLLRRRHIFVLRARGLGLSLSSILLLHAYWVSVQLGYVLAPLYPGNAEFWIMGTWFPCGVALFHASNSRFLHVAKAQRRFAGVPTSSSDSTEVICQAESGRGEKPSKQTHNIPASLLARFRGLKYTNKVLVSVGVAMALQVSLTSLMYLISRKWHRSWGIPGTGVHGTEMERKVQMGQGWEWWPSVVWQFFWAWFIAPLILWRARDIHDTQGWRLQTVACCLANLHATPMWLIALYVPQMETISKYFIPPQWIALSIMITEAFTILLPCWQVRRHEALKQETLDFIAQWESRKGYSRTIGGVAAGLDSVRTASSTVVNSTLGGVIRHSVMQEDKHAINSAGVDGTIWTKTAGSLPNSVPPPTSRSNSDESIMTMGALEHVLGRNPEPLREFAALRDFSGENIAFLIRVAAWRASVFGAARRRSEPSGFTMANLPPLQRYSGHLHPPLLNTGYVVGHMSLLSAEARGVAFTEALIIYVDFISASDAEFPINISSQHLRKLQGIFEGAAKDTFGERRGSGADPATPFPVPGECLLAMGGGIWSCRNGTRAGATTRQSLYGNVGGDPGCRCASSVPSSFDEAVFDDAERSIKYLVLTNTWPKFVRDRRRMSSESLDTTLLPEAPPTPADGSAVVAHAARWRRATFSWQSLKGRIESQRTALLGR